MAALGLSSCGVDLSSLAAVAATDFSNLATIQEYDTSGIPIYGYDGNNAVYGYDSNNQPIYSPSLLATAVSVPNWEPQANAQVVYPAQARRTAEPPLQVRQQAPLKHRNPVVHGSNRSDRTTAQLPSRSRVSEPGLRSDRTAPPFRNPGMFGAGSRPDRTTLPSRNPGLSGPGARPDFHRPMRPGQHPERMAPNPQRPQRHPHAGPGSDRQQGEPSTSKPTAPAGVKVAPDPTTTAQPASSNGYVCMSCSLGDTLIKKCTNKKCVNYGNPPSSYKKR